MGAGMSASSQTATYDFVLNSESKSFTNVSSSPLDSVPFTDISSDDWYYDTISAAYNAGLIQGITSSEFAPEQNITGEQYILILYRMAGNLAESAENEQDEQDIYADSLEWAQDNSIIDPAMINFQQEDYITRENMMVLSYKYMLLPVQNLTPQETFQNFLTPGKFLNTL